MKALNRAIARTTGDITKLCAFHIDQLGTKGCAVKQTPETLKQLEQHLAALLEMEREQLEVAGIKSGYIIPGADTVTGDGTGEALPPFARGFDPVRATGKLVAFSTPQEKNGSLFDRFVANGMMEDDGFRDSGEARKLGITPASILAQMHQNDGGQMAALEKACEAATNYAREALRYMNQRDGLMDVLVQVSAYFETGKIRHDLDVRQVVNCALEHFRRDGVGHNDTAVTTRAFVEHQTKVHAQPLPPETEANLPPKPMLWYQTGVRSAFDPSLQQPPSAASEQPVPVAPDAIDMTDPANWQEGDILLRTGHDWLGFYQGREYRVDKVKAEKQEIYIARDGGAVTGYTFDLMKEDRMFKWLRHGEAQQ